MYYTILLLLTRSLGSMRQRALTVGDDSEIDRKEEGEEKTTVVNGVSGFLFWVTVDFSSGITFASSCFPSIIAHLTGKSIYTP